MIIENDKWILNIQQDEYPENPRSLDYTDCNVSKMVCFHKRYNLGDKQNDYNKSNYNSWDELKKAIIKNEDVAVILPMYAYEHSDMTISTSQFDCGWDSGQIGFVYVTKESILEHLVVGAKYVTKKLIKKAIEAIQAEIETYRYYIEGEVYRYSLTNKETNELDDCSGFYGSNIWTNGISDYLPAECIIDLYPQLKAEFGERK
jgi:hypothetical protein